MDNKFKLEMTRHESLIKPILNPQSINIELLFKQITILTQEREQWKNYCIQLEKCNKNTNEVNDQLLSKVTILEDVFFSAEISVKRNYGKKKRKIKN